MTCKSCRADKNTHKSEVITKYKNKKGKLFRISSATPLIGIICCVLCGKIRAQLSSLQLFNLKSIAGSVRTKGLMFLVATDCWFEKYCTTPNASQSDSVAATRQWLICRL